MNIIFSIRLVFLLLNIFIALSKAAEAAENALSKDDIVSIINNLKDINHDSELYNKMDYYLKEMTLFDNQEYNSAIKKTGNEFNESISKLGDCIKDMDKIRESYSSKWISDYDKLFDMTYTKKNIDSIKFIMLSISAINNMKYCEEPIKIALFNEIKYRDILAVYLRNLQSFAASLNDKERTMLANRIGVINSFLDGPQYPLKELLSGEKGPLFSVALNNRKGLDPLLVKFFSTHPFFKKPFDPMKTFTELEIRVSPRDHGQD